MYIEDLIAQGEHGGLEFKFEINDSRKIAKTLVAFANTKGGRLLVGVKDNGVVAGASVDEEYYMVEGGAKLYCRPEVLFEAHVHTAANGKHVIEFVVAPGSRKPYSALAKDGREEVYIRVNDENVLADPVWVMMHKRKSVHEKVMYGEKHNALVRYIREHSPASLLLLAKNLFLSEAETEKILADLASTGIITINTSTAGTLFSYKDVVE